MKNHGKKTSSWEGLSPEQKAERLKKMAASRTRTKKYHEAFRLRINKAKYEAFLNQPSWMSGVNSDNLADIIEMLREVFHLYSKTGSKFHDKFLFYVNKLDELEKKRDFDITGTEEYQFLKEGWLNAAESQGKSAMRATYAYQILTDLENYHFRGEAKSPTDIILMRSN